MWDPVFPPLFPVNGSLLVTPAFPPSGPGEPGSPISSVLCRRYDVPVRISGHLWIRSRSPCYLLLRFQGIGGDPKDQGAFFSPAAPFRQFSHGRGRDLTGSQAIHPVPLPRSKTPAEPADPRHYRFCSCCPRAQRNEGSRAYMISGPPRGFGTCCLRFTNDVAIAHARLASGWLASLYREGVEPSGSQ